jgi:hypothetical protein
MMQEKSQLRKLIGRSIKRYALLMGAQIRSNKEEYALSTGQRSNDALLMNVLIMSSKEEHA